MNVTLQIEAGQLGETVIDLFKNLTVEKKEEVALTILKEWFSNPVDLETKGYVEILLSEYRNDPEKLRKISYNYGSSLNDLQIKESMEFRRDLEKYKNTKQYMIEDLRKELLGYFKKGIEDEMKKDVQVQEIKDIVYEEIKNMMPEIMMTVVTLTLTNNMVELQHKIQENIMTNYNFNMFRDDVMKKLNNLGQ